jgi:hypothetical protein
VKVCDPHSKSKVATIDKLERIRLRKNVNWFNLKQLTFVTGSELSESNLFSYHHEDKEIS